LSFFNLTTKSRPIAIIAIIIIPMIIFTAVPLLFFGAGNTSFLLVSLGLFVVMIFIFLPFFIFYFLFLIPLTICSSG